LGQGHRHLDSTEPDVTPRDAESEEMAGHQGQEEDTNLLESVEELNVNSVLDNQVRKENIGLER